MAIFNVKSVGVLLISTMVLLTGNVLLSSCGSAPQGETEEVEESRPAQEAENQPDDEDEKQPQGQGGDDDDDDNQGNERPNSKEQDNDQDDNN